jgi:hypothetical protein
MQRGLAAIKRVEVPHQPLQPLVRRILQRGPVERSGVVPFRGLRELLPHEQELLARMAPHEPVIGAQVGEFLIPVPRHLAQHRALAMHHLVMADRQDEVLRERVGQPKVIWW